MGGIASTCRNLHREGVCADGQRPSTERWIAVGALVKTASRYLLGKQALNPAAAPEVFTKLGRMMYTSSALTIAFAWYTGWRRLRGEAKGHFPIPGIARRAGQRVTQNLSAIPALAPFRAVLPIDVATDVTGVTGPTPPPSLGPSPPGPPGFLGGKQPNLIELAHFAQRFGLRVSEHPMFGGVHPVHAPNSYHYKGRAFDASGSVANMTAFANFVAQNYGSRMTELFWRGPGWVNIKLGVKQSKDFVSGHTDHVHVAV